jgi:hypothetical protein
MEEMHLIREFIVRQENSFQELLVRGGLAVQGGPVVQGGRW